MEQQLRLNWKALVATAIKRRKEQKISQAKLATLVGVSKPTVNSFEQGKTSVTLESALKILAVLGLVEDCEKSQIE